LEEPALRTPSDSVGRFDSRRSDPHNNSQLSPCWALARAELQRR
jgi:hypothetical protein